MALTRNIFTGVAIVAAGMGAFAVCAALLQFALAAVGIVADPEADLRGVSLFFAVPLVSTICGIVAAASVARWFRHRQTGVRGFEPVVKTQGPENRGIAD